MPAIEPKTEDQDNCVVVFHPSTPCRAALECAGCLDIARLKQFLALEAALDEKQSLSEVVKIDAKNAGDFATKFLPNQRRSGDD